MSKNLFQIAKQKKIKYFLISFVDLFGVLRSKLVPAHAIKEMQNAGAGFAGFAAWLDMTPADSDMFGIPDPDSLIQLPWNKEVGWHVLTARAESDELSRLARKRHSANDHKSNITDW